MTMVPTQERHGLSGAKVACDGCGAVVSIRCDHMRSRGRPGDAPPRIEVGHAVRKLNSMGWRASATRQTCKTCIAMKSDKPKKEELEMVQTQIPMTQALKASPAEVGKIAAIPDTPKPTLAQRREIMLMLEEVYDVDAKRYKGVETDKSVAHALGIERWGWVSEVRDGFFGPAGNEAADLLAAEVKAKIRDADVMIAGMSVAISATKGQLHMAEQTLAKTTTLCDELAALLARVKGAK